MKARLIVTHDCLRNCEGCCNKDWKYEPPKIWKSVPKGLKEIIITGGEPLLYPIKLHSLIVDLRKTSPNSKIYMYTADPYRLEMMHELLDLIDGVCLTLHDNKAAEEFAKLQAGLQQNAWGGSCSLRLNIFAGVKCPFDTEDWDVRPNYAWIKDCPLPKDETLHRLEEPWTL